jgi:two-component system OmpR family response regulator
MEVLVIDDESQTLDTIGRALRAEGVIVTIARTGHAALAALARGHFDAVVLDLDRPMLDGPDFYRILRALPRDIPVLALSGGDADVASDRLRGLSEHAGHIDMAQLVEDVRRIAQAE